MFAFQILENIGMTMGVMPVTGLTLPFFSAGPTSLVSLFSCHWAGSELCVIHVERPSEDHSGFMLRNDI